MRFSTFWFLILALSLSFAGACGDSAASTVGTAGSGGDRGTVGAGGVGGPGGTGGDGSAGGGVSPKDSVEATFALCCEITQPINIGRVDASVDAIALATSALVPGETGTVEIEAVVDLTGAIPVQLDATLVEVSRFRLSGTAGTSSSGTFDIPVPQAFNTGDDPLLIDAGMHEVSVDVEPDAAEVCVDLTDTQVTVNALGTDIAIPCTPGTCADVANSPACLDVSE